MMITTIIRTTMIGIIAIKLKIIRIARVITIIIGMRISTMTIEEE